MYIPLTPESIEEIKKQLEPTMQDSFHKICVEALDTEVTPLDEVKDNVACAHTMSTLLKKLFPDFPIIYSVKQLDWKLWQDKRFERIAEFGARLIVCSPSITDSNGVIITHGHIGYSITDDCIASNDSRDGIFRRNYTWNEWIKEFRDKRKLKIYLYKVRD